MQSYNISFSNYAELSNFIKVKNFKNKDSLLIQIFSGVLQLDIIDELREFLNKKLPHAKIIGSTTDGEIFENRVTIYNIIISFTYFDYSELTTAKIDIVKKENSFEYGKQLANKLINDKSKVFIIFLSGLNINAEYFLNGIKEIAPNIIVAGGLAGDNAKFKETYVINNKEINSSAAVAVSINSDKLHVNNNYTLAWQNLGKIFKVNKSSENILYEIDNMTPYDLYKNI